MPVTTFTEVYEMTLIGTILGQETRNVFYYGTDDTVATALNLCSTFELEVLPSLLPCVCDNWRGVGLTAQQVVGGSSFGALTIDALGQVTGDSLPPFVCFDFTYIRGGARERNGYKRFAGVPESRQVNGTATSTEITLLNTLAGDLAALISHDTGPVYTPVIKRTAINRVHLSTPQYWSISGVVYSKIGSQNSRKFGHGR